MVVDEIARRHGFAPWRRRFQGETSEGTLDGERVMLLKPLTLHERVRPRGAGSGQLLQDRARRHRRVSRRARTAAGEVRVKIGGGIAGHNGLRSISAHVGNDYRRVRLGIGHPGVKELVHRHVLKRFRQGRQAVGRGAVRRDRGQCRLLATGRTRRFQNKVHLAMQAKGFATNASDGNDEHRAQPSANGFRTSWDSNAASSDCPMSASRRCSTR